MTSAPTSLTLLRKSTTRQPLAACWTPPPPQPPPPPPPPGASAGPAARRLKRRGQINQQAPRNHTHARHHLHWNTLSASRRQSSIGGTQCRRAQRLSSSTIDFSRISCGPSLALALPAQEAQLLSSAICARPPNKQPDHAKRAGPGNGWGGRSANAHLS